MADYLITWLDYASDQYLALDQETGSELNERLRSLARYPTTGAQYDRATDHWTIEFDSGRGLVVYVVNDQHQRIVILRLLRLT